MRCLNNYIGSLSVALQVRFKLETNSHRVIYCFVCMSIICKSTVETMNSLLMIIATATVVSALPFPLATVSRYTSPGEIDWYEDGPEDFVATVQIGGDDYAWEAPPSDSEGREEQQALYEDVWSPEEDVNGGAARRSAAEDELMAVAASGARGFHMRQGAWRRGVRAYDPHHWNRLPRAHHSPHAAQEAAAASARTQQEIAADPVDDASE